MARRPAPPEDPADAPAEGRERLARRLARAGIASRRMAEGIIAEGRVRVNGREVDTPAFDVGPADRVEVDGRELAPPEPPRLWRHHKPAGLVTTESDERGRPTVFERLPPDLPRVMSVGRLDLNSEGLLLLTNDGALKRRLELPSTGWLRRYRVRVHGRPTEADLAPLAEGLVLDGERFGAIEARLDRQQGSNAWLSVSLREGRNREVRRALSAVGLEVSRLIRVGYGPFQLNDLEPGAVEEVRPRVLRDQLGLPSPEREAPAPRRGRPAKGGEGEGAARPDRARGGRDGGPDRPAAKPGRATAEDQPRRGPGAGKPRRAEGDGPPRDAAYVKPGRRPGPDKSARRGGGPEWSARDAEARAAAGDPAFDERPASATKKRPARVAGGRNAEAAGRPARGTPARSAADAPDTKRGPRSSPTSGPGHGRPKPPAARSGPGRARGADDDAAARGPRRGPAAGEGPAKPARGRVARRDDAEPPRGARGPKGAGGPARSGGPSSAPKTFSSGPSSGPDGSRGGGAASRGSGPRKSPGGPARGSGGPKGPGGPGRGPSRPPKGGGGKGR